MQRIVLQCFAAKDMTCNVQITYLLPKVPAAPPAADVFPTIGIWLRNGLTVSAAGLLYLHPEGGSDVSVPVLRVRNCDEVSLISAGGSFGGGSSGASSGTTNKNPDGSTTTTTTDKATGTVTEATKSTGDSTTTVETKKNGTVTETVKTATGTVAVIVNADGTEKIVSTSVTTENGVALPLDGGATVKIIDNAKSSTDVPATNVFYNEICALSAREIMIGTSSEKFDLNSSMTPDQIANVAARSSPYTVPSRIS